MIHGDNPECDRLTNGKSHMELVVFWRSLSSSGDPEDHSALVERMRRWGLRTIVIHQ
jgi:hypothetical protein